ncbi:MAG TPA: 4-(cytidine 5'-diphospho)-2-C-methyl-D-erythritol kinase [Roseiarcus sp.]
MRWLRAPAKINLTLRVIGRRADGYHELESLVAFAGLCDWIGFEPGPDLVLEVRGPRASEAGPLDDNLVLRAARALAGHIPGVKFGRFRLVKRLPAAAGLGGGSADAAAALRLLADEARLSVDDRRVRAAARGTGADVLACLRPQARMMTGVGDQLGPLIPLPKMFALLVNPRVQAPTPKVFAALGLAPGSPLESSGESFDVLGHGTAGILDFLASSRNDLDAAAVRIAPAIAAVRQRLAQIPEAVATGMSGSGATCFALFGDRRSASLARRVVAAERPDWWVEATAIH